MCVSVCARAVHLCVCVCEYVTCIFSIISHLYMQLQLNDNNGQGVTSNIVLHCINM